jgi:hypothetical protein
VGFSLGVIAVLGAVAIAASTSGAASLRQVPVTARVVAARAYPLASTTASNKRRAVTDAVQLLAYVVPPAGAVVHSSGAGAGPKGDHLLTSAFASAYAYRTWIVTGSVSSVLSSVTAHLPGGSTVISRGSGSGPGSTSQSIIFSWPPVPDVLNTRWLEVGVATSRTGTLLTAESQSEWVVARPLDEHVPAGVRDVEVTNGWPGKAPFLAHRVENRAKVGALVALFDSLGIIQPGAINCPAETAGPVVTISFDAKTARPLAEATVSSYADQRLPASVPEWACYPVDFSVLGRHQPGLAGNVIAPIQRLLHITLRTHG